MRTKTVLLGLTILVLFLGCFSPVAPDPAGGDPVDSPEPAVQTFKIYVDGTGGDDTTGDGSMSQPLASIHAAIDAIPAGEIGEILVAEGLYEYTATIFVDVADTIIRGGYDPGGGWTRDIATNPTVVQNTSNSVFRLDENATLDGLTIRTFPDGGTAASGWSAVTVPSSSNTETTLNNVTIHVASTNSPHFAVRVFTGATGSMTITDSVLYAGAENQDGRVGGLYLEGADTYALLFEDSEVVLNSVNGTGGPSPLDGVYHRRGELEIRRSVIRTAGSITATDTVSGVLASFVNPTLSIDRTRIEIESDSGASLTAVVVQDGTGIITNSVMRVTGAGSGYYRGYLGGSGTARMELYNNSIVVQADGIQSATGIFINPSQDNVTVKNNIVIAENSGTGGTTAITGPADSVVETNAFFNNGSESIDADYSKDNTVYTTIAEFGFTDPQNDLSLTASSPVLLQTGGENLLGIGVSADLAGNARTSDFSIGAFEY